MSDTSEESSKDGRSILEANHINESLCRDFLRGMCDRKFCKFKHEFDVRSLNFCHDFQNSSCPRAACKFIHCTAEEVDDYKRTGGMSNQILAEATRKNQLPGIQPICNAFRKGTCRRIQCKYRHITKEEEDAEIMVLIKNNNLNRSISNQPALVYDVPAPPVFEAPMPGKRCVHQTLDEVDDYGPTIKRRFIHGGIDSPDLQNIQNNRQFKGYFTGSPPQVLSNRIDARTIMLEEENSMLHKEVAHLKKQVSDLIATNEFLLDQNAALRVSGKRNGTVSGPPVTLTSNLSQNNQQVIRTVAASVATVPVSLATVTTCNPVSVGCPAVSIAPAAQILAPSQQILVTTNQPTQLAIANSSQAQLAIAQQNLANNLAQQAQPQLTSQAQQLALATTTQQLTSQAQQLANQQLALASAPQQTQQIAISNNQQLTLASTQQAAQQLGQQLSNQAQQQLNQQLTSQAQQLSLVNTTQQLTSQAQQLALANTQQLTSQAQQLALANTPQQLAVAANVNQQLALASTSQQLLATNPQLEMHVAARAPSINGINTSQTIAMSNATVSYPIMTHTLPH